MRKYRQAIRDGFHPTSFFSYLVFLSGGSIWFVLKCLAKPPTLLLPSLHRLAYLLCAVLTLAQCARPQIKDPSDSLRKVSAPAELTDTVGITSLKTDLTAHIDFLESRSESAQWQKLTFGKDVISLKDYLDGLKRLAHFLAQNPSPEDFSSYMQESFHFYEVYGKKDWGEVLVTGYYEPVLMGSRNKTEQHSRPLYKEPSAMLPVDWKAFIETMPALAQFIEKQNIDIHRIQLRARVDNDIVQPFFSREEIDSHGALQGQSLELAWVDPVDAFFLHIQGSGTVRFKDGQEIRIGYKNQNGHTYTAIGRLLLDAIPLEEMSMQRIREHLQTLPPEEIQDLLNSNQSYVFFQKLDGAPVTSSGMTVIPHRTIAADSRYFPKGALAYLQVSTPKVSALSENPKKPGWHSEPRFVFDHDRGGAVRGPGHVDLYFGKGDQAGQRAGLMKETGRLYYLVPAL